MKNTGISKLQHTLLSTLIASAMTGAHAEDAHELPVVQVTGTAERSYKAPEATVGKTPLAPREIPNSVSILTREQMDDQGMTTMQEALQQVTGVTVIANDASNAQYYARGYSLGVMYDGVTSYNGLTPSHQLDLSIYDRIEILRGPAGLLQGVSEPGGVVNLVKKKPQSTFKTSWSAGYGSFDNKRLEGDVTGALNADKTLRARLVAVDEDRGYFYHHTQSQKLALMGALEYDLTPATTLSLSLTSQDYNLKAPSSGLPTSSEKDSNGHYKLLDVSPSVFNAPDWGKIQYKTDEIAASAEHRFDNRWIAKASYSRRSWHQYYKYAYSYSAVNALTNLLDYSSLRGENDSTREGLDLFASGPFQWLGRTHNLLVGVNEETYWTLSRSGSLTPASYSSVYFGDVSRLTEPTINYTSGSESITRQHGLYSQVRFSIADPLTWVVGARTTTFKNRSRKVAPSTSGLAWADGAKANNEITPYTGLVYTPIRQLSVYGSASEIFVPQTQIKADGSTLDPRTGTQGEIGIKGDFLDGKLGTSLAFFNLRDKNRAYADPAYPTSNFFLNAGEIESKGYEVEVTGQPFDRFDISAGYTNLTTTYLSDRSNQGKTASIFSPKHQFKLWGNYHFSPSGPLSGLSMGMGIIAQSKVQSTRGWRDEVVNSGYAVFNSHIAYQIDRQYSLNLAINNVFDTRYYASVGTPNNYNFFGEPRSFMLTLKGSY